jgi:ATP-dependent Clp protease adaptor protein ClpS
MSTDTATVEKTSNDVDIREPDRFRVVFLNDNTTPMEFVVDLLKVIFHHSHDDAVKIMLQVHEQGKGTAGVYTFEIAEQKAQETTQIARTNGHGLGVTVELDG